MIISSQVPALARLAAQQHEPSPPAAIVQAVTGPLSRRGYRAMERCTTILGAGLSTARGLAGATGPAAMRATGLPGRRRHYPVPATVGSRPRCTDGSADGVDGRSGWIDLDGPVHYIDFGGPASGPTVVCVHGLAGMAVNWSAIAPLLTPRYRVLAPDLAGHGLTQPGGRGTSVAANRALLHRFIQAVVAPAATPVILIGNSMGGMISLLEASAVPDAVAGLVLIDPVLPLAPALPDRSVTAMLAAYATPGIGPALMGRRRRMSPEALVASVLSLCCVDAARVPADVRAQHVAVAREFLLFAEPEREISAAARSIVTNLGYLRGGAYRRAIRSITQPVLLLHGARDRVMPVAIARAAARSNPAWTLAVMPGVGHVPQLEAPRETANAITGWLGAAGRCAAQSATPGASARPATQVPASPRPRTDDLDVYG
jgi:pimeloyl-ACP methyl ester carboxylesterase